MNINLELYRVFLEVAKAESISKAAKNLNISQPAVSQSIQTLEDQLGGKLFIRTPKGVILTNEGQELYNYIQEGMNYFINGTNKFKALKELDEGKITIGSTTTIAENFLSSYLKEFHNQYPNVQITIVNHLTDTLLKELRNGNIDIAIIAVPDTEIHDLEIVPITTLHDIFVGNEKYKTDKTNQMKEILKEDILLQKLPSVTRKNFNQFLKDNSLACTPKMEVVSHGLLRSLTKDGFGISILTKEFITNDLNNTLFEIQTDTKIPERTLGFAIKKNTVPSFTVSKLIEIIKQNT